MKLIHFTISKDRDFLSCNPPYNSRRKIMERIYVCSTSCTTPLDNCILLGANMAKLLRFIVAGREQRAGILLGAILTNGNNNKGVSNRFAEGNWLLANPLCPYCQRVYLLLDQMEISYQEILIDFKNKPEWMKEMTPFAKIPVLVDNGKVIYESISIIEYLSEIYRNALLRHSPDKKAKIRGWGLYMDSIHTEIRTFFSSGTQSDYEQSQINAGDKLAVVAESLSVDDLILGDDYTYLGVIAGPLFLLIDTLCEFRDSDLSIAIQKNQPLSRLVSHLAGFTQAKLSTCSPTYRADLYEFVSRSESIFMKQGFEEHPIP